jgi:NADP-dependent 3-hydroxy acid dehydrogenase YdfG
MGFWMIPSMNVVLVTGASTGLGLAISRRLIEEDLHIILTPRASSISRFEKEGIHESDRIWIRTLDITDPAPVGDHGCLAVLQSATLASEGVLSLDPVSESTED